MKLIKIKELNIEVEEDYHYKPDNNGYIDLKKIKIPKGMRLLKRWELLACANLGYIKEPVDEICEQPYADLKKEYPFYNLWFLGLGGDDRSGLDGGRGLGYDARVRGVRFCRDIGTDKVIKDSKKLDKSVNEAKRQIGVLFEK